MKPTEDGRISCCRSERERVGKFSRMLRSEPGAAALLMMTRPNQPHFLLAWPHVAVMEAGSCVESLSRPVSPGSVRLVLMVRLESDQDLGQTIWDRGAIWPLLEAADLWKFRRIINTSRLTGKDAVRGQTHGVPFVWVLWAALPRSPARSGALVVRIKKEPVDVDGAGSGPAGPELPARDVPLRPSGLGQNSVCCRPPLGSSADGVNPPVLVSGN
ncbi:hypothetical protein D4764_19G0004190 [Takifugu flavidus]|uniref:Uncharacterized protein n=1 Tax=Takifugu flavidus TaxID=433684 RepID=A0A5C6NPX5_9TELE|nr:hypothetical protein D4764_19G0004190 [Takifugu flavidus]